MKKFMLIARLFLVFIVLVATGLIYIYSDSDDLANKTTPVAIAGLANTRVSLQGSGFALLNGGNSYDPDGGEIINYRWSIVDTPKQELLGSVLYSGPDITGPDQHYEKSDIGAWVYELEVTDDEGQKSRDTKIVFVQDVVYSSFNPNHLSAGEIDFLHDSDEVLGVVYGDEAIAYPSERAYPYAVINDMISHEPIYVVYCETCLSGVVRKRMVNGNEYTFTNNGATLGEEQFIVTDKETGSEWNAVTGIAKNGPSEGIELEELNYEITTWGKWVEKHPGTMVFTGDSDL